MAHRHPSAASEVPQARFSANVLLRYAALHRFSAVSSIFDTISLSAPMASTRCRLLRMAGLVSRGIGLIGQLYCIHAPACNHAEARINLECGDDVALIAHVNGNRHCGITQSVDRGRFGGLLMGIVRGCRSLSDIVFGPVGIPALQMPFITQDLRGRLDPSCQMERP